MGKIIKQAARSGERATKNMSDPGGVMWNKPKKAPATSASTPLAMPTADDEAVAAAKRRKMAAMQQRGGRASTILGGDDRLGG